MTVMFSEFFGVPHGVVRSGKLHDLSGSAFKLYAALCYESERYRTREFTRKTGQLRALVGCSRNSHAKARAELIKAGLIEADEYGAEGFVYRLCDPKTGKPWPGDPRIPIQYQKKNISVEKGPMPITSHQRSTSIANTGTEFSFGHNVTPSPNTEENRAKWDELHDIGQNFSGTRVPRK